LGFRFNIKIFKFLAENFTLFDSYIGYKTRGKKPVSKALLPECICGAIR